MFKAVIGWSACVALVLWSGNARAAGAAKAPLFGAWRNLHSHYDAVPERRDMPFAMLPRAVAAGTRLAIFDRESRRAVCCLVAVSGPLDEQALRDDYQIPGVWVTDLTNGWNEAAPYVPVVQEMRREGALAAYAFPDRANAYSDLGGLLLPADATVGKDNVVTTGTLRYRIQHRSDPLADDDGALDHYTLVPLQAPTAPVKVDVGFGTY